MSKIEQFIEAIQPNRLERDYPGTYVNAKQWLLISRLLRAGEKMYKDLDDQESGYTKGQSMWDLAFVFGRDEG